MVDLELVQPGPLALGPQRVDGVADRAALRLRLDREDDVVVLHAPAGETPAGRASSSGMPAKPTSRRR
jgi:hypothetical protein